MQIPPKFQKIPRGAFGKDSACILAVLIDVVNYLLKKGRPKKKTATKKPAPRSEGPFFTLLVNGCYILCEQDHREVRD